MAEEGISRHVQALLADHIDSVGQLEILLLLHREAQRQWSAADVARELRIDADWAAPQLVGLSSAGLLAASASPPPLYRYWPRTPELDQAVKELARAYAERRVAVITLIYAKPVDKLRAFSDAFRLRKEDSSG